MSSSCCWLPLLLLAFGVSGADRRGVESYCRCLGLTVAFLAAAFYFTYRPRKAASASGDCCAPAKGCCAAPATKSRFGMMTLNKVALWGVTVVAVAFLFFPQYMKYFLTGGGAEQPAANNPLVRTTTLSVEGMTCEGCAVLVEKVVTDVPGVLTVKVDYDTKRMVVTSEARCPAPAESVVQALQKAGYRAAVIESDPTTSTDKTGGAPQGDFCEKPKGDCCETPAGEKAKAAPKPIDPQRQVVFTVDGFT